MLHVLTHAHTHPSAAAIALACKMLPVAFLSCYTAYVRTHTTYLGARYEHLHPPSQRHRLHPVRNDRPRAARPPRAGQLDDLGRSSRGASRSSVGPLVMSGACFETAPGRGLSAGRSNGRSQAGLGNHPHPPRTRLRMAHRGLNGHGLPVSPDGGIGIAHTHVRGHTHGVGRLQQDVTHVTRTGLAIWQGDDR